MPVIQNFSVPAGDDVEVTFNMDDDTPLSLPSADIYWNAYEQEFGIPDYDKEPVISKSVAGGGGIVIPGSPDDIFVLTLSAADTAGLLHNYYHEAEVVDVNGNRSTVTIGIMTVTLADGRNSP